MNRIHQLLLQQSDVILVLAVMGILLILIIPFPPILLDFLLCLNLSLSVLIVLITLSVHHPLEFAAFPSLLLLTTLFRLALNVASTRLILLHGHAGQVIQAFGQFVVGGDALVGTVIFLILVVIQFIVITKGANRISEVAARFTLDAMPGKQMSIDADLNSGAITEAAAQGRRKRVTQEAEFYGAMDGAGKFVRGDAIAGIIIIAINIVGGFILGLRRGISPLDALRTYTILTVGDGIVSQIPALLIALATGVLSTKSSSDSDLAAELKAQFTRYPRAIAMTTGILLIFGIMPGLPTVPFWGMSLILGSMFYFINQSKTKEAAELKAAAAKPELPEAVAPEEEWLALDRIRIELGYKLIELADGKQQPTLMDRIVMLREQLARELGIIIPAVHIVDNIQLSPYNYSILLDGEKNAEAVLYPRHFLVIANGPTAAGSSSNPFADLPGIETKEPAFGLAAKWIDASHKEQAEAAGYTVINDVAVFITHLSEILKKSAHQLLSRDDVFTLLEIAKKRTPKLVEGIVPDIFSVAEIHKILQNLLAEKVTIRNLQKILQTLSLHAGKLHDLNQLTELVRQSLAATICLPHQEPGGVLSVITLAPDTEYRLRQAILPDPAKPAVSLSPDFLQKVITGIVEIKEKHMTTAGEPILLANMEMRRGLHELVAHTLPDLAVLSFQEVLQVPEVKCIGMVQVKSL